MRIEYGLAKPVQLVQFERHPGQLGRPCMTLAGTVVKMPIENDALRRHAVEIRRGDPVVAVAAEKADVQTARFEDEDLHIVDCSGTCRSSGR